MEKSCIIVIAEDRLDEKTIFLRSVYKGFKMLNQ